MLERDSQKMKKKKQQKCSLGKNACLIKNGRRGTKQNRGNGVTLT